MTNDLIEISDFTYEVGPNESNPYKKFAKAENTLNARLSDWQDFCYWCQTREPAKDFLPADPQTVGDYLADRAANKWIGPLGKMKELKEKQPLKLNSIYRRLSTISVMHKRNGYEFDSKHPAISDTIAGIRRVHGTAETKKTPILIDDMRKMIEALPDTLIGLRDRALLLIGFAGALRRSELSKIQFEDLAFPDEGLEVFLRWTKTGTHTVNIPFGSNPITCPVRNLKTWLQISQIKSGAIFRPINRHGQIQENALSHLAVAIIIKRNLHIKQKLYDEAANLNPVSDYSGHSLRAGFVTTAIMNGVQEHLIMNQTGHKKSDTIKKYIRLTNKWKDNAATKLGL